MKYIHQNQILEFSTDISKSVELGVTLEDSFSKLVALSADQIAFSNSNPAASALEIWNCKLNTSSAVELTVDEQRKIAYATETLISWNGETLTCDQARLEKMSVYFYSDQLDKYNELKTLWMAAREAIQEKYK